MHSRVKKWGNSQGLRLSQELLRRANLSVGDAVEITVVDEQIIVKKATPAPPSLAELLSRVPEAYEAEEMDWGGPVGREEW